MRLTHAYYVEDLKWLISFIQYLYKVNSKTESRDRIEYFQKWAVFTEILFKAIVSSFFCSSLMFLLYPFFMYFTQGQLVPIAPLYLPGIDENTLIGYVTLTIYHLIVFIAGTIGFSCIEFLIAIISLSSLIIAKLISLDLQRINVDLEIEDSGSITVKGRLMNVFLMHRKMDE